jgi:hypothetical protein
MAGHSEFVKLQARNQELEARVQVIKRELKDYREMLAEGIERVADSHFGGDPGWVRRAHALLSSGEGENSPDLDYGDEPSAIPLGNNSSEGLR